MKRLVRSTSGREIYGPEWQNNNMDYSNATDIEGDDALIHSPRVSDNAALSPQTETTVVDVQLQTQTSKGIDRRGCRVSDHHQSMYRATLEGDYAAVEMLLERDQNSACDEINEDGDRALHVAASMRHQHSVRKLVDKMSPSDLSSLDGRGYTAYCYAAILGAVEIADILIRKNSTLVPIRDQENKTPLLKAASRGNAKLVSYFLNSG